MKNLYLGQKRTVFATVLALFVAMLTIALPGGVTIAEAQNTNPFGCAPGEIFLSSQEWWTNPGGVDRGTDGRLGDDFGHIHTELCFPHMQTVSGEMTLRVRSVMHHNPGSYDQLAIVLWDNDWRNPNHGDCTPRALTCIRFQPDRTLNSCEASGGNRVNHHTCVWTDDLTFDTSIYPYDGWQQLRVRSIIEHRSTRNPNETEIGRTSTGLHLYFDNNNGRTRNVYMDPNVVESRGWYTGTGYATTNIQNMPTSPVSGIWRPEVEMTPGSDGINLTTHIATLNPNFHNNDGGDVIRVGNGQFRGQLEIDTRRLPDGWHKLVLKANQFHHETGSTNSAVGVYGFEVRNGNQAPESVLTIQPPGPINLWQNTTNSIPIMASNNTGAAITLTAFTPGFATFQDMGNGTGLLQANPGNNTAGMHIVQIQAQDAMGGETTKAFEIIVAEGDAPAQQPTQPPPPTQVPPTPLPTDPPAQGSSAAVVGDMMRWHPVEVIFDGPYACEAWDGGSNSGQFNPFLHRRMNVTFTNGNRSYTVPGFFDGDSQTAYSDERTPDQECGNKWVARFTPDEVGTWTYTASFRRGNNIAINLNPGDGQPEAFDGATGAFNIAETNKTGNDIRGKGFLRYVGTHHARFDNGEYFIKTGADSPENFLGYVDFHNTFDHEVRDQFGPFVHSYDAHAGDYSMNPGELWGSNRDQGRNIYGAVNYLSSVGVNSIYMINYGIDGGDGGDVWAWSCPNGLTPNCNENKLSMDISKLDQWDLVLRHMTESGIHIHFVLSEAENDNQLNDLQRQLFYREMIARFGHNPAMIWNIGEEYGPGDPIKRANAAYLRDTDPFDHQITVHTFNNQASTYYDNLFGDPNFDATSIQGNTDTYNDLTIDLRSRSAQAGKPWIIYVDEQSNRVQQDFRNWGEQREEGLWGNLMGGGAGIQWYIAYQNDAFSDVSLDNFRLMEPVYVDSAHARNFFQQYVPNFWEMTPNNGLVSSSEAAYALVKPGETYVLYFENALGNNTLDLSGIDGTFTAGWYSPRTGAYQEAAQPIIGGSNVSIGNPPFAENAEFSGDSNTDYAVILRRSDGVIPTPGPTLVPPTPLPTSTPPDPSASIQQFVLVDSVNDVPIRTLTDGESIDMRTIGTDAINIEAVVNETLLPDVGSVTFALQYSGEILPQTENVAPYVLFGDNNGNYASWEPPLDDYILDVMVHSERGGNGQVLGSGSISFSVIESDPNQPTLTPTVPVEPTLEPTIPVEPTATLVPTIPVEPTLPPSPVPTDCPTFNGGEVFVEQNGLVIVEAEAVSNLNGWTLGSNGDVTGSFIEWTGPNRLNGSGAGAQGLLEYYVQINTPGVYRFNWRSNIVDGQPGSDHNDSWVRVLVQPDSNYYAEKQGNRIYPRGSQAFINGLGGAPNGSSGNGFFKVYRSGNDSFKWDAKTSDNDGTPVYVNFASAGVYTVQIAGRSNGHKIDRFGFALNNNMFQSNPPTSPTTTGGNDCGPAPTQVAGNPTVTPIPPTNVPTLVPPTETLIPTLVPPEPTETLIPTLVPPEPTATLIPTLVPPEPTATLIPTLVPPEPTATLIPTDVPTQVPPTATFAPPTQVPPTQAPPTDVPGMPVPSAFLLVSADTNTPIMPITNGDSINMAVLPTDQLNIVAQFVPGSEASIGSVIFQLSQGNSTHTRTENVAPYAVYGDRSGNYIGWNPSLGEYTLTAMIYSGRQGSGEASQPITVSFSFVDYTVPPTMVPTTVPTMVPTTVPTLPPDPTTAPNPTTAPPATPIPGPTVPMVQSLILVDAEADVPMVVLTDGALIDMSTLPTNKVNIIAEFAPEDAPNVGSVAFNMVSADSTYDIVESRAPYALFGNVDDLPDYNIGELLTGQYTLTATVYSEAKAEGEAGTPLSLTFSIINEPPTPVPPTPTPVPSGPSAEIVGFVLVDAASDNIVGVIPNNATLDLNQLPSRQLNIIAQVNAPNGALVQEVLFQLTGTEDRQMVDDFAPYSLIGEQGSDFLGWTPAVGDYVLRGIPLELVNGTVTPAGELAIQFTVIDSAPGGGVQNPTPPPGQPTQQPTQPANPGPQPTPVPGQPTDTPPVQNGSSAVTAFILIDAASDIDLSQIQSGAVIDVNRLPHRRINIRVDVSAGPGETISEIEYQLSGPETHNTRVDAPYALWGGRGNNNYNYNPWQPTTGSYSLTAIPHLEGGGTGTPRTIQFTIEDSRGR